MAKRSTAPGMPGWNGEALAWLVLWLLVPLAGVLTYFRAEGGFVKDKTLSPLGGALLVIGVLSLLVAVFWVPWLVNRCRTNALASLATKLAMKFTSNPGSKDLREFSKLSVFHVGSAASLRNLMVGRFGGADVRLVDFYCKVGPGRDKAYRSKTTVVIFPRATTDCPDFVLIPRIGFKTRASVINVMLKSYPDLEIGNHPVHAFASHYRVAGPDRKALGNLFSPQVMDFFVENKNWNVEMLNHQAAVYQIDRVVKVNDYPSRLENALCVLKALTRAKPNSHGQ